MDDLLWLGLLLFVSFSDQDGGWVNISSGTGSPGYSRTQGRKTIVVVVVPSVLWRC